MGDVAGWGVCADGVDCAEANVAKVRTEPRKYRNEVGIGDSREAFLFKHKRCAQVACVVKLWNMGFGNAVEETYPVEFA